jgi:cobaltochelatase CobN
VHLPAGEPSGIDDGNQAVDLGLPAGDIVFLSSAESEITTLTFASSRRAADAPVLRLANIMQLGHPLSVDLFVERTLADARLVVVRILGGAGYWPYGLETLRALARGGGPQLAVIPGESRWDPSLEDYSTVAAEDCRRIWRYLVEGGVGNSTNCLRYLEALIAPDRKARQLDVPSPELLPKAGFYQPGKGHVRTCSQVAGNRPRAAIVFYRSLLSGGSTEPIDCLVEELAEAGLDAQPIFIASLKDKESAAFLSAAFAQGAPAIVLNTTAFAASTTGVAHRGTALDAPGRPVLQVVLSGSQKPAWQESTQGMSPRDLTMNVVLPEVDGRILTRPVSFKETIQPDTGGPTITVNRSDRGRARFVAAQARAWVDLARTPAANRRIALVLSNYPDRDGRIANGVGLDTPESTTRLVAAMTAAGYRTDRFPKTGAALMARITAGRTNASRGRATVRLSLAIYREFIEGLPKPAREALMERWGEPESDPAYEIGEFHLAVQQFGNTVVGIQPPRGYGVDPKTTYHDPDLVPTHGYLAFYVWLRREFGAHAMVHMGKHGNLEWLPGKALGLSEECWPEVALGPTPLIYPFIVNDPGEGSQTKRRASAVVIDHLMPAMTRAEIHGGLARLETLIDEYYLAMGVDPRRQTYLAGEIVAVAEEEGLDRDLRLSRGKEDESLQSIDAHLCELKEMQIRDGLHVFGASPRARLRSDTLVAIARVPRSGGDPAAASLHRAIADDLKLSFDPLDHEPAERWTGSKPDRLAQMSEALWRTQGDTVERIELLAVKLVASPSRHAELPATNAVLDWIAGHLAPALDGSGYMETGSLLAALDGHFVAPGPSGAPTRGRPEVLPTGRNFYSVDVRAVPTAAAWELGRRSAEALALRYFQDEGAWPTSIAMSAWATSNMRTGGDDIAHVMALIGARPEWEPGTGRVTGFSILSLGELRRPRIDVTLRISGMFRDAFPGQIELVDSAMRAIADLEEDETANPIAAAAREARMSLRGAGMDDNAARNLASTRIFGSKPGAYGAGLQALIDTGTWQSRHDFADAFLAWGGFAYGAGRYGTEAGDFLGERLTKAEAVYQAQDNREHDILDSDDYYQFQGGLAATVEALSGEAPRVYHGDSSRPEKPVIRSLKQEIARVVRGRAANPKWIAGVMRHGYKGAFEIAATVDYLFAFAATTEAVDDHHFDQLFNAYLGDEEVRGFLAANNPHALGEIAARLREAIDREMWSPRSNSAYDRLSELISMNSGDAIS